MTGRSGAIESAVESVLAQCPDAFLPKLADALQGIEGASATAVRDLVELERTARRRMGRAFWVMAPMFQPRMDGVAAQTFPAALLRPIWDDASRANASVLTFLDGDDEVAIARVSDRLCAAAAATLRHAPTLAGNPALAEDMAAYFDLSALLRPMMRRVDVWSVRPDEAHAAQLRLLLRDCAAASPDGITRAIDVILSHLPDAALILRVIAQGSETAGRGRLLAASELAVYVERLFDAVATRVRGVKPPEAVEDVPPLVKNMTWCGHVLGEVDAWIHADPASAWGSRANAIRTDAGWFLAGLFAQCGPLFKRGLPMERVALAGHMTRLSAMLSVSADAPELRRLGPLLALLAQSRSCSEAFGCEAGRRQVLSDTVETLTSYADETLERVNAGDAQDERTPLMLIDRIAELLTLADDVQSARALRRRRESAARRVAPSVSPEAA